MLNFVQAEKVKLESNPERSFKPTLDRANADLLGKNFFKICEDFKIDPKDQVVILGQKHLRTIQNWKKENTIGQTWDEGADLLKGKITLDYLLSLGEINNNTLYRENYSPIYWSLLYFLTKIFFEYFQQSFFRIVL